MTTACEVFAAIFLVILPIASFIGVFLIFLELRAIRKIHEARWNYESTCALIRLRKKFYSPKSSKTDRLLAKNLIAHLYSCGTWIYAPSPNMRETTHKES